MPWQDDISANLPPPNEGEPANLRQDILDELADHLSCAMQRELRRTDDPNAARHAVLKRFGRPETIARTLWLDAMKEQLMNQRMMLVTQLAMIAAIAVLSVVVIVSLRQNARMQESLLSRLESANLQPSQSDAGLSATYDWPSLQLRFTTIDGSRPVENVDLSLSGDPYGRNEVLMLKTNSDGAAVYGPMQPGAYKLTATGPDNIKYQRQIIVPPGPRTEISIPWPKLQPQPMPVKLGVQLPTILSDWPTLTVVSLQPQPLEATTRDGVWSLPEISIVVDHRGRVSAVPPGFPSDPLSSRSAPKYQPRSAEFNWREEFELDASLRYVPKDMALWVAWPFPDEDREYTLVNSGNRSWKLGPVFASIKPHEQLTLMPEGDFTTLEQAMKENRARLETQPSN